MDKKAHVAITPDSSGTIVVDGKVVAYREEVKGEGPFAGLAVLKKDAPAVEPVVDTNVSLADVRVPLADEATTPEEVAPPSDPALVAEVDALLVARLGSTKPDVEAPEAPPSSEQKKPKQHAKPRTPFLGIRKIEIAQVEQPATPAPSAPRGTIHPREFLALFHSKQLTDIAQKIIARGGIPDVVIWTRTNSGFDHVRIKVVVEEGRKGREARSHLEIAEAIGRYKELAQYIGQMVLFVEVKNLPDKDGKLRQIPHERGASTMALNKVFLEAKKHLAEGEARRKASRQTSKPKPEEKKDAVVVAG